MAKFLDNLGFGGNQQQNQSLKRTSRSSGYTSSGRRSTGRHPGTVIDPEHDGRLHHGEMTTGKRGQPLLSEEEWLASHHVPHPGARGNRNAVGPHDIPPQSLERIREGGRKGGKAHLGMKFQRINNGSSKKSSMRNSRSDVSSSGYVDNRRDIEEARALSRRLQEVLGEIAG